MGLRYQRRINLGGGLGLNVSGSGVSPSVRTPVGSFGPKGASIRSGIPGLSFRTGKRGGGDALAGLLLVATGIGVVLLALWLVYKALSWVVDIVDQYEKKCEAAKLAEQEKALGQF